MLRLVGLPTPILTRSANLSSTGTPRTLCVPGPWEGGPSARGPPARYPAHSHWSRLAPGMYCVCWLCACCGGAVPSPLSPGTASLTHPPGSGTTTVSRYGRKLFLYEVCLRIYVLVISCFSFLLCSLKDLVKDGGKRKRKQIHIFGYTQTFF